MQVFLHTRTILLLTVLSVIGMVGGCADEAEQLSAVTGRVTFNGLPALAEITFAPRDEDGRSYGRPSTAHTNEQGQFKLQYTDDRPGAVVGMHRVTIKVLPVFTEATTAKPQSFDAAVSPLKITQLTREVQSGGNHYNFPLSY